MKCFGYGARPPNHCRAFSASATLANGHVLIVGGFNGVATASAEVFDGHDWKKGRVADLPDPVSDHCLVKINDTVLASVGGTGVGSYNFLYDLKL
jgi:hypothetical protein